MRRRLFTIASAGSLLICLTITALWIQSYRAANQYSHYDGSWTRSFGSSSGSLYFMASAAPSPGPNRLGWRQYPPYNLRLRQPLPGEPGVRHHWAVLGVFWYITDGGTMTTGTLPSTGQPLHSVFAPNRLLFIPHWLAAAAFAALPAIWLVTRRRRCDGPHCTACGYNLTANTSGVCPECGTPVPRKREGIA